MRGRDRLFDGLTAPPTPAELRRRIRTEIASATRTGDRSLPSAWHLLWAIVVLLSLAAHFALDLSHGIEVPFSKAPRGLQFAGGAE